MPILPADQYWKLRALLRDLTAARAEMERTLETLTAKAHTAMTDAGLDPTVTYRLDDVATSAEPESGPA